MGTVEEMLAMDKSKLAEPIATVEVITELYLQFIPSVIFISL